MAHALKAATAPAAGPAAPASLPAFGGGGGRGGGRSGGPGDGPAGEAGSHARLAVTIGMSLGLAAVAMFFLALTSAFVVRRGLGEGWGSFPVPALLWVNTAVLAVSSVCAERARRRAAAGWAWLTLVLGLVFLAGQALAWSILSGSGLGVGVTPFSSFVWLFTGAHAVHLAGGLLGLAAAAGFPMAPERRERWIHAAAIYWHFMGVLWVGLFALLVFWR